MNGYLAFGRVAGSAVSMFINHAGR